MGVFLASTIVEVAVVAACCHSHILDVQHRLQFFVNGGRVVCGLGYANLPWQSFLADAVCHHFAANLNHVVFDAAPFQQVSHDVAAVAFGNGAEVEHGLRVLLEYAVVAQHYCLVSHCRAQRVDGVSGGRGARLESESPRVDKRSHGYVERSVGVVGYFFSQLEHAVEHIVGLGVFATVDACYYRVLVEHRQRIVHLLQFRHDVVVERSVVLIGDVVVCAEHLSFVVLIGCVALLQYDVDCCNDEKQQKHNPPSYFLLAHKLCFFCTFYSQTFRTRQSR